jgi:hypothetical protein
LSTAAVNAADKPLPRDGGVVLPEPHLNCVYLCSSVVSFSFSREEDNFDADSRSAVRRIEDDNPGDLNQRKSASKRFTNRARKVIFCHFLVRGDIIEIL